MTHDPPRGTGRKARPETVMADVNKSTSRTLLARARTGMSGPGSPSSTCTRRSSSVGAHDKAWTVPTPTTFGSKSFSRWP